MTTLEKAMHNYLQAEEEFTVFLTKLDQGIMVDDEYQDYLECQLVDTEVAFVDGLEEYMESQQIPVLSGGWFRKIWDKQPETAVKLGVKLVKSL